MIPLSGFLSRMLSTRVIFTISAGGFTLMSFMCAHANSINEMILWRALQGFIGGGMIPTVFASAFTIFPRDKQPLVAPIIGLVATLAPTIGPTVGGYLTDWFSWHWLFLVNLGPGVIVTAAAWLLIDFDEPDYSLFTHFDYVGLLTMAGFLGAMEYALEEGPSKDWFESGLVTGAIVISAVSGVAFFWRMATARQPIVDLTAFRDRNFWTGTMFAFVLGIGLYGLTYIYPVYLAVVRGYSSLMIGKTMFVTGLCMFFTAPLRRAADKSRRPADHDRGRVRLLRRRDLPGLVRHRRLGLLGAPLAAGLPRRRADAVDGADQQSGARHDAAAEDQERLRPLQPDAQPRRRGRPRPHQHPARQADGSASPSACASR